MNKVKTSIWLFPVLLVLSIIIPDRSEAQGVPISKEFHGLNAWYIDCKGIGTSTFAATFISQLTVAVNSGARYVRIGGISPNWEQLYDFDPNTLAILTATRLVHLIDEIRKVGMEPIIQVSFAPPTLTTSCPVYTPQSGMNPLGNLSEDQQAEVAANLVELLNDPVNGKFKFKPILNWSIANEPDHSLSCSGDGGFGWDDVPNAGDMSRYIKKFAGRMKDKDVQIRILAPEFAMFGNDQNWKVNQLMSELISPTTNTNSVMGYTTVTNGTVPLVDYVSFHYYSNSATSLSDIIADPTFTADGFSKKLNSTGLTGKKGLMEMVQSVNRVQDPVEVGCTEYNIDLHHTHDEGTASGYTAPITDTPALRNS